jgi:hypothetical protein
MTWFSRSLQRRNLLTPVRLLRAAYPGRDHEGMFMLEERGVLTCSDSPGKIILFIPIVASPPQATAMSKNTTVITSRK